MVCQIIWIGFLVGFVSLMVGYLFWLMDPNGPWQTMVFTTMVLAQMGNVLAIRSNRESLFAIGFFSNWLMVAAVVLGLVLQLLLIYVPFFQRIFSTQALSGRDLGICLVASVIVFAVVEIYKWVLRSRDD